MPLTPDPQKLAKVTHYNFIANFMQVLAFETPSKQGATEVTLGILPLSHSYGLILAHGLAWRGDSLVLHGGFDMQAMLKSIMQYKIERLYLVRVLLFCAWTVTKIGRAHV